jgi:hypothetical protein
VDEIITSRTAIEQAPDMIFYRMFPKASKQFLKRERIRGEVCRGTAISAAADG